MHRSLNMLYSLCISTLLVWLWAAPASAWIPAEHALDDSAYRPDGIHVLDGSYVMNVNELHINITNHGLIGSQFTQTLPYSHAPSAQWPAGSGIEYLWGGGLWVGGFSDSALGVSTGQPTREFRPSDKIWDTIYEARDQRIVRPTGNPNASGKRIPDLDEDDDHDGRIDEEILNGRDDDGDGRIDEDFAQIGEQMMTCTMYDNTALASEFYPDHFPLNLKVTQTAIAFDAIDFANFVAFKYEVTNIGNNDIDDLVMGFYADCDIGPRQQTNLAHDDRTGYFEGLVRSSTGLWSFLQVGYMYDAGADPVPGYFGVTSIGAKRFNMYKFFRGARAYEAGGIPVDDFHRYEAMTRNRISNNFEDAEPDDYSFLVSTEKTPVLAPDETTTFELALAVGDGLNDLLEACANVHVVYGGTYFDLDHDPTTGVNGRETYLCFPEVPPSGHDIYKTIAQTQQLWCVDDLRRWRGIIPGDFEEDENGRWCIWVNSDNCVECARRSNNNCDSKLSFVNNWNCWDESLPAPQRLGCTGIAGREARVPWYDTRLAPPPPMARVWPRDKSTHIFWNDESEHVIDFEMEVVDFESYRLWRSDDWARPDGTSLTSGPNSESWRLIAEYDVINEMQIPRGHGEVDTLSLGRNTGLEGIAYRPSSLDNPHFDGLAAAMQEVVDADPQGFVLERPQLRNSSGVPIPNLELLIPWESYPTVLDTFFMVATRAAADGVVPKRGARFYEYVDRDLRNGFQYFYSITATDHAIEYVDSQPINRGDGLDGSPNSRFYPAVPATKAQTIEDREQFGINIYAYPNPATRKSLAEFQQYTPAIGDPTGVRISFANLPEAKNRIRIYTVAGDQLTEIHHDGTNGNGQAMWNFVTDNGQEIVSGIYLYSVESDQEGFEGFVGKFVVVR